jgi:hypothetical protein
MSHTTEEYGKLSKLEKEQKEKQEGKGVNFLAEGF